MTLGHIWNVWYTFYDNEINFLQNDGRYKAPFHGFNLRDLITEFFFFSLTIIIRCS